jgi:hypothetical protein
MKFTREVWVICLQVLFLYNTGRYPNEVNSTEDEKFFHIWTSTQRMRNKWYIFVTSWHYGLYLGVERNGSRCLQLGGDGFLYVGVCSTVLKSQVIPYDSKAWKLHPTLATFWLHWNTSCVPIHCNVTRHYLAFSQGFMVIFFCADWTFGVILSSYGIHLCFKHSVHDKMKPTDMRFDWFNIKYAI